MQTSLCRIELVVKYKISIGIILKTEVQELAVHEFASAAPSLRELESDDLISRTQYNEIPSHVDYSFTQKGKDLLPIFYEMTKWGFKYIE